VVHESMSFNHLLYSRSCSSVACEYCVYGILCEYHVYDILCEYCVYGILCEYRVYVTQIVGIQHQIHNWCIKTWKLNVAGARFYTGRLENWCIKYSVTSSVKQTPACQSTTLPKRKTFVCVCVCVCLCVCVCICATRLRSCRSV
jgi:hypothetical protein